MKKPTSGSLDSRAADFPPGDAKVSLTVSATAIFGDLQSPFAAASTSADFSEPVSSSSRSEAAAGEGDLEDDCCGWLCDCDCCDCSCW